MVEFIEKKNIEITNASFFVLKKYMEYIGKNISDLIKFNKISEYMERTLNE